MFAARQIFLGRCAKAAWRNPYVTDGLVAQYDGEWNAGGGVHDAAATVWKDLAGNCDAVDSRMVFGEKSVNIGYIDSSTQLSGFPEITGNRTVRIVAKRVGGTFGQFGVGFRDSYYWYFDNAGNGYGVRGKNGAQRLTGIFADTSVFSVCVTIDGSAQTFYINGTQVSSNSSSQPTWDISPRIQWRFADFYNIAVYNRALTADEIAGNYAIDKERFNLP